jgi:predicted DNA-binding transcriptional regulator YafY
MSKTERLYKIERLVGQRRAISFDDLQRELEVSRATLHRDLQFLRDRLGAPIVFDRERQGYCFVDGDEAGRHQLPGLWFSEPELYSLLLARQLLASIDAEAMFGRHLQPLLGRIEQILGAQGTATAELTRRVKIVTPAKRVVDPAIFEALVSALLGAQRLQIDYFTRSRKAPTKREVSPQRLIHYRGTWYLDAWCHKSEALRRFALDSITSARLVEKPGRQLDIEELEAAQDAGYGIFAGTRQQWATLIVSAETAAWISREEWHPLQKTRWLDDGRYEMRLPYAEPMELVMDVLRYHGEVQVSDPPALKALLLDKARQAVQLLTTPDHHA